MKRVILIITGLLGLVVLTGCIDAQSTIVIKKDGSGYIIETMYMSKAAQDMMKGMTQSMGADATGGNSGIDIPSEEKLTERAAKLGKGVKFESSKAVSKADGSKGYSVTYSFSDVTKIKVSLGDTAENDKQNGGKSKQKKQPPVTFGFKPGSTAKLTVNLPQPEKDPDAPPPPEVTPEMKQQMAMQMGMMGAMLKGMRMRMMLKVDGEITSTTASNVTKSKKTGKDQYVVLFDINFDKLMTNQDLMTELMMSQESGGDMSAIGEKLKAVDGISFETAEKVEVSFK